MDVNALLEQIDAHYNANNDVATPEVSWVENDLVACVGHLLKRIESLESRVAELDVATGGLYWGSQHKIRYLGQVIRLTLNDIVWNGAAGRLQAEGPDGQIYEAFISTKNHWPMDAAWERVNYVDRVFPDRATSVLPQGVIP